MTDGPQKIKALKDWPLPSNITEMRQFLGFVNYYMKFVKSFADHTFIRRDNENKQ